MFKTLTDNFIEDPVLDMELDLDGKTDEVELFGRKYRMYKDDWKHHVHLKCTNRCDAFCSFCIESCTRFDPEDADTFFVSMDELLRQMSEQKALKSVSITGGEPTIFSMIQPLVDRVLRYNPLLLSMNSNGTRMLNAFKPDTFVGWFDLSKHAVDDTSVFRRSLNITPNDIRLFKRSQPRAQVRVQCVLGVLNGMKNLDDIFDFMNYFKRAVDNFSFRSVIMDKEGAGMSGLFKEFRNFLFKNAKCLEQTIQDYYVYEVYEYEGANITVSWSNMYLLRLFNEQHPDSNFLEEIIVHPDGVISGSWDKKTLVIYDPAKGE